MAGTIIWECANGRKYLVPEDACPVCEHCTDILWDFTNGPYMFFCDIPDTKPWEACKGGCPKYEIGVSNGKRN